MASLFTTKAQKNVDFYHAAKAAGLRDKMNPEKLAKLEQFVKDYLTSQAPIDALRDYHLKVAPLQLVFDKTHTLVKSLIAGLEFWSLATGNAVAVQAETGAWLVGEDEADDLARAEKFHAAFVKFYGAAALPPALKAEEMRKHTAAHRKAQSEMPKMPPGQQLSTLRAGQRELSATCDACFDDFHDFLDGYYGKTGDKAYAQKSDFGFDRRAGRYRPSKPAAGEGEGSGDGEGTGGGDGSGTGAGGAGDSQTAAAVKSKVKS